MSAFDTNSLATFFERADAVGVACRRRQVRDKLMIDLSIQDAAAGRLEFYHPDQPRFEQVHPEHRDRLRDLWDEALKFAAVARRASQEFEHYLTIYEPYRHEYVEFSALADCVIRLFESEGLPPPRRSELIGDLAAIERAYEAWTKEMK
jgi:hypothetical protein